MRHLAPLSDPLAADFVKFLVGDEIPMPERDAGGVGAVQVSFPRRPVAAVVTCGGGGGGRRIHAIGEANCMSKLIANDQK